MALSPTDLSSDFIESGMRLITQPSSDVLLKQASINRERVKSALGDALPSKEKTN